MNSWIVSLQNQEVLRAQKNVIFRNDFSFQCDPGDSKFGAVARLVGIEGGVVSGAFNLESPGVEAPDWRPRHGKQYHEV